jgi:hypothetical protein
MQGWFSDFARLLRARETAVPCLKTAFSHALYVYFLPLADDRVRSTHVSF